MSEEFAWAVGIFEGEGCIYDRRGTKDRRGCVLSVKMTDEDIVRRFASAVGVGTISGPHNRSSTQKPYWSWQSSRASEVLWLLQNMLPLLGGRRRAKAEEVMPHLKNIRPNIKGATTTHGTKSCYVKKGCRCEPCRIAFKEYRKERGF